MKQLATIEPTAKNINEAHRLARSSAETAIGHAIRCGQMLAAKKTELARGNFDAWVEINCEFGRRTAYNYMKAGESCNALHGYTSLRQALGYDKPAKKTEPAKAPARIQQETVSVLNPKGTEETGNDRPAVSISAATPPPEFDFTDYEPEDDDAYKANMENVLMADDKLSAMRDELQKVHRELMVVKSSRDHYMSQAGEAVRLVKARDREIERLKKQIKALEARRAA